MQKLIQEHNMSNFVYPMTLKSQLFGRENAKILLPREPASVLQWKKEKKNILPDSN